MLQLSCIRFSYISYEIEAQLKEGVDCFMYTIILVLLSALASLIQMPIAGADFRFSAGIIVLIAGLLLNKKLKPIPVGILAGFAVFLMRVLYANIIGLESYDMLSYFLEVFFYLGYVLVYRYVVLKDDAIYRTPLVVGLSLSDFGGNALEYFIRLGAGYEDWNSTSLTSLLIAAFVRSVLIILLVYIAYIFVKKVLGRDSDNPLESVKNVR